MAARRATPATISLPRRASRRRCRFWSRSSWKFCPDELVGGEEEAAGARRGVEHRLAGTGAHAVDDGVDERARGEVLAGAALGVLGVLLQQALVGVALDVDIEREPALAVDEVDDETA